MNQSILTAFIFCSLISFGQKEVKDSSKAIHFIYIVPTSLFGNLALDLENYWVELGYGYKFKKSMYCFGIGAIVDSSPHGGRGLFGEGVTQRGSTGFGTSIEYKRIFSSKFYCALQLNFEHIKTIREEKYVVEFSTMEEKSNYVVFRNEVAFIPRVGFVFLNRKKLSCDINLGTGIRYIWSENSGKKNIAENIDKEFLTKREFDSGQKFAQRLSLQFRVGYGF